MDGVALTVVDPQSVLRWRDIFSADLVIFAGVTGREDFCGPSFDELCFELHCRGVVTLFYQVGGLPSLTGVRYEGRHRAEKRELEQTRRRCHYALIDDGRPRLLRSTDLHEIPLRDRPPRRGRGSPRDRGGARRAVAACRHCDGPRAKDRCDRDISRPRAATKLSGANYGRGRRRLRRGRRLRASPALRNNDAAPRGRQHRRRPRSQRREPREPRQAQRRRRRCRGRSLRGRRWRLPDQSRLRQRPRLRALVPRRRRGHRTGEHRDRKPQRD